MFNKIYDRVLKFDLFSKPVDINIDGQDSSRSIIGAIVSLSALILAFILTKVTFLRFINQTDPEVVSFMEYDTKTVNMTAENFLFSVSFFSQLQGESSEVSNYTNNYTNFINIQDIPISCPSCNMNINNSYYSEQYGISQENNLRRRRQLQEDGTSSGPFVKDRAFLHENLIPDYSNRTINSSAFPLMYCKGEDFDGYRFRSLNKKKSRDLTAIMQTLSFCLPPMMNASISEENDIGEESMSCNFDYEIVKEIPSSLSSFFTVDGAIDPSTGKRPPSIYKLSEEYWDSYNLKDAIGLSSLQIKNPNFLALASKDLKEQGGVGKLTQEYEKKKPPPSDNKTKPFGQPPKGSSAGKEGGGKPKEGSYKGANNYEKNNNNNKQENQFNKGGGSASPKWDSKSSKSFGGSKSSNSENSVWNTDNSDSSSESTTTSSSSSSNSDGGESSSSNSNSGGGQSSSSNSNSDGGESSNSNNNSGGGESSCSNSNSSGEQSSNSKSNSNGGESSSSKNN